MIRINKDKGTSCLIRGAKVSTNRCCAIVLIGIRFQLDRDVKALALRSHFVALALDIVALLMKRELLHIGPRCPMYS